MSYLVDVANDLVREAREQSFQICIWHVEEALGSLFEKAPYPRNDVLAIGHRIHTLAPELLAPDFCVWLGYVPVKKAA